MPTPFRLTVGSHGSLPVLRVSGAMVYGQDLTGVTDTLVKVAAARPPHVIVDLSEVEAADSTGISVLLEINQVVRAAGGHVVLLRPPDRLRSALHLTRVSSLFDIAADDAELAKKIESSE
jgi:anti-anti-sigma factor